MPIWSKRRPAPASRSFARSRSIATPLLFFLERYDEACRRELGHFIHAVGNGTAPLVGRAEGIRALVLLTLWINWREPAGRSGSDQPILASVSVLRNRSTSTMKAIDGTSNISAVMAAIW